MSRFNQDVLLLIFEELQDDSKSLFSCLMVNRLWCEVVIPVLWRNPWCHSINDFYKNSLYDIITCYLTDDIKEFLTKQKIRLPQTLRQSPLFDYLSFCRSINVNIINNIISVGSSSAYNQFLLQQEFYNILIEKCSELKYLDMRSIRHQIFYFPDAKVRLESLCELICDTTIDSIYFYGLTSICQNIQRLIIINAYTNVNYGIVKLIEVQRNLKYFQWKDNIEDDNYFINPYEEIFLALIKKANTLNHLIIYGYEHTFVQLVLLPELFKLKTLKIDNLLIGKDESKKLIFRYLETFNVDYIRISTVTSIIENNGGHLKEILVKYYDFYNFERNFSEDSLNFIRKIYKHCPSIEYLALLFPSSNEHFSEFEKLLNICQNLKSLLLIITNINGEIYENGEKLLKILINSAPINLKEIRFFNDFKFSLKSLEEFLEKWNGRPKLNILTTDPLYIREDYINLINNYKNNGVIKDFKSNLERNVIFKYEI